MLIFQLKSIASTSCNESSHDSLHIPQIAALDTFFFTVWGAVQDEGPLEVLTPARCFKLHVDTLHYYGVFHYLIPSYAFIVERQIKNLEDKHYPMSISCKSSEIYRVIQNEWYKNKADLLSTYTVYWYETHMVWMKTFGHFVLAIFPVLLHCRAHRSRCSKIPYRFEQRSAPRADAYDGQLFGDSLHQALQRSTARFR